jgi:hypothetical protein
MTWLRDGRCGATPLLFGSASNFGFCSRSTPLLALRSPISCELTMHAVKKIMAIEKIMMRASPEIVDRNAKLLLSGLSGMGLAILAAVVSIGSARAEDQIELKLDRAQVLQLPANASIVVLGNPIIADVTLIKKSNSMILTGKSFGETNLIALDRDGHTVGESMVRVAAPASSLVVQLGTARQTYSCNPRCQPSFSLGDDTQYASGVSGQIQSRNSLAQPTGH